jgi:hypothetical protein
MSIIQSEKVLNLAMYALVTDFKYDSFLSGSMSDVSIHSKE